MINTPRKDTEMRIITGTARGRNIKTLEGLDVRPTTQRVKEAIFSSIQFEIEGALVADLFCGSGQLGIESLSRGSQFCVFVDNSKQSVDVTKENLMTAGFFKQSRVVQMDVLSFLKSTKDTFDIAFLDPPYSKGLLDEALPLLSEKMSEGGVILAEHDADDVVLEDIGDFKLKKQYKYGRIVVSAYRHK